MFHFCRRFSGYVTNRQTQNQSTDSSHMDLPGLPEGEFLMWVGGRGDRDLSRQIRGFTAAELHTRGALSQQLCACVLGDLQA